VEINHGNGYRTRYGHNSRLAVRVGQRVKKGQIIAYVGNTGTSTGPHVHYEVRLNNVPVDPTPYLN
jgi:murein DD-endopeptidase MepM/ murein hydrolase activator NlpD